MDDYGLIGMLGIFMGVASVLQDSGFSIALINRQEVRHEDYNSVFWFSFTVGIICYIILFFSAPLIADFYEQPELTNLSRILFLWLLISSTSIAHSAMLTKKLMIKERMKIEVSALFISGTIGVILAFRGFAYWGIAIQTVSHAFVGSSLRWYYVKWRPTFTFDFKPLKAMYSFGIKVFFTSIFGQINANIFSILLGRFYKPDQVGYFTQGNKWMTMGSSFIGSMVGNVSLPVLSEVILDAERQRQIFRKMLRFTSFISFPAMFGLAFVAPEFIMITVSDKWLPCVPIMQLLCVWGAVIPISSLYTHVLLSRGKSDIYMYSTITLGLVQLIIISSMLSMGIFYMVMAFVVVNLLWMFVWHYFVNKCIRISLIDVLRDILPYCVIVIFVLVVTSIFTIWISNPYILFVLKILLVTILYSTCMYVLKSTIFREVIEYLLVSISPK